MTTKTVAESYIKLSQREHILKRPDTYVGSKDAQVESRWVITPELTRMEYCDLVFNPALYRIYDELIVNALDQVTRMAAVEDKSKRVSRIVVTLTPTQFIVYNDGESIPITVHPEYKVMVPELVFAHLLTSSNYDEKEEKTVGGQNG